MGMLFCVRGGGHRNEILRLVDTFASESIHRAQDDSVEAIGSLYNVEQCNY